MEKILIGHEIRFSKTFSQDDVLDFSRISEDNNPIHIDEEHAAESIFGKRVVHGVLILSMFSKIFGTLYPGNGTIYLSQTAKFLKPAFINDNLIAKAKLISFDEDKFQGVFITECFKESDKLIFTGEAKILFPRIYTL
jgi:3-hydroxybutyryl-CoA dehydratase